MKVRITNIYPIKKLRGEEMNLEETEHYYIDKISGAMFTKETIIDNPQWFEKLEEDKPKPRWKVGDYVVYNQYQPNDFKVFIKIHTIAYSNTTIRYNGYKEEQLRDPTEEELKQFYR